MIGFIILTILLIGLATYLYRKPKSKIVYAEFNNDWKTILNEYVPFYTGLNSKEQRLFEKDILSFLNNHTITGVDTTVDDVSRVLIGASAIIPIFYFDNWNYPNLKEVLLFETEVEERVTYDNKHVFEVQGKVMNDSFGNGVLMLAKDDLINGFQIKTSKQNVGIHEFVHMIDKADGTVDGSPELLMNKKLLTAWSERIFLEIEKLKKSSKSDINPYGATSSAEFLAVISEYFFKRPSLLQRKHPDLYQLLDQLFHHKR